ncbi:MAG: protease complex subunit PrcB family protein [Elusimicrobiota bacterium]|jgi:hypothetical protein
MKRYLWALFAVLSSSLILCLGLVLWRAHRSSIIVHLGRSELPALPPPPAHHSPYGAPAYTNEELQKLLQKEGLALGIDAIAAPGERTEPPGSFLGPQLGAPGSRAQADITIGQLNRMRRALDASHKKAPVPIIGRTVPILAQEEPSGPARSGPAAPGYWSGPYGGVPAGTFTISDDKKWRELWASISASPAPGLDFSQQQVAAVFLGHRPTGGFQVEISPDISVHAEAVIIRYREISPAPGRTPPEGATAPFALRAVSRTDLPTRFERIK